MSDPSAAPQPSTADVFSAPSQEGVGQGGAAVAARAKRLNEIHTFLLGEGPLEGVWCSEKHPLYPGTFWWRAKLRAALRRKP